MADGPDGVNWLALTCPFGPGAQDLALRIVSR